MDFSKDCLIKVYDEKNYLANVLVPLSFHFKKVIFFARHRANSKRYNAIKKLLEDNAIKMQFVIVEDESVIDEYLGMNKEAVIDVSGNKYLCLYLFEKCVSTKRAILYYDDEENVIKDYRAHQIILKDLYRLRIKDIIALSGADYESNMHKLPKKEDFMVIKTIMKEASDNYQEFTRVIGILAQAISKEENGQIVLSKNYLKELRSNQSFAILERHHILYLNQNRLIILKDGLRPLLINAGAWLETYLYIVSKESGLFDEEAMSVVIDFKGSDKKYPITCEIDLVLLLNNRLLLVSCKSNKVDAAAVNEICLHNYVLGNNLSSAMVATMEDLNVKNPTIYEKAKELSVSVLDMPRLMEEDAQKIIFDSMLGRFKYEGVKP